jgi:hypothetical protein
VTHRPDDRNSDSNTLRHPRAAVAVLLIFFSVTIPVAADAPSRSIAVPEVMVRDRFLAYLFALVRYDLNVTITGADFLRLFPEFEDDTSSPVHFLRTMSRSTDDRSTSITLDFTRPIDLPAPVDVLGSRPIQLRSSPQLRLEEARYARPLDSNHDLFPDVEFAYVFRMADGFLFVDLAPWLDFILGSIVDDMDVDIVVVARYRQSWYGLMAGLNPDGDPVSGVFDLRRSRFLARPPRDLTAFVRSYLRTE